VEVDLRRSADGALVVMHDASVDRTTDGCGRVAQLTLAELRRLDAGRRFDPAFADERIPTLDQVLDAVPRQVWLNLQVKRGEPIAGEVTRTLARRDRLEHAFVAGGADALREARAAHPDVRVCDLERRASREEYVEHAVRSGADFIQLHHRRGVPDPGIVERAQRGGLRVNHFCTPEAAELERLFRARIDFPLVDDVERGLRVAVRFGVAPLRHTG
jgi:glycerophosphoryl diester phosphodiesterase